MNVYSGYLINGQVKTCEYIIDMAIAYGYKGINNIYRVSDAIKYLRETTNEPKIEKITLVED